MATINTIFSLTDNVSSPLNNINRTVSNSTKGFESMAGKIVAINSALNLLSSALDKIKESFSVPISDASEYESLLARLTVATGDASVAQKEFAELKDFAARTPFDLPGVVQASVMFRNAGIEAEKLIPTIRMLGDVAQGNNEYFNRMALNYMQIKSAGVASMRDLKEFAYIGVPIMQVLSDMGVTGTATATDVENAFKIMTREGGQFYKSMESNAGTFNGLMSNMRDSMQQFNASIGDSMLPSLKELIITISDFFNIIQESKSFEIFKNKLNNMFTGLVDNLDKIINGFINLTTVVAMVASTFAIYWAVINWPITLTIVLIATFVRALLNAEATIADSCAVLGGTFGLLGTVIIDVFNLIYNAFVFLYNASVLITELIANVLFDPFNNLARLVVDLVMLIIDALALLANAIDIIFGTNLTDSLNKANETIDKWKRETFGYGKFHWDRLEMKEMTGIVQGTIAGANFATDIGRTIESGLAGVKDEADEFMDETRQELSFDSNGNLKTSVQNEVKISDEYKQLLAEKAVQKYQFKYTQLTPELRIENVSVSSNVDIDSMFARMADKMDELSGAFLGT